ncbi:metallophosphoesterase family protein [Nocardia xishanensis]|uniref:metallophosphoesterase family protein n=1 Tax=Nocardia xishanensis TaxID=238964 RepID=UPI0008374CBF|nr:metallophosphoesterase [Nocardia xishanensis]
MTAWEDLAPTRLAIAGDWHGNQFHAVRAIEYAAEQGADVIVHVGDFAYDFKPKFMAAVQRALEDAGLVLGFVPGNHENWTYLDTREQEHGCTAIPLRPNIFYLPRCYRWTWGGVSFLALGGAHSVDRPWRVPGKSWWRRETITQAEADRAIAGGAADVMICHDVPSGVRIPCIESNPLGFPQAEIYAADVHRARLREVVDVVQPRRLFAGHYHCRLTAELDCGSYRTQVDILADDSAPLADNTTLVDI